MTFGQKMYTLCSWVQVTARVLINVKKTGLRKIGGIWGVSLHLYIVLNDNELVECGAFLPFMVIMNKDSYLRRTKIEKRDCCSRTKGVAVNARESHSCTAINQLTYGVTKKPKKSIKKHGPFPYSLNHILTST